MKIRTISIITVLTCLVIVASVSGDDASPLPKQHNSILEGIILDANSSKPVPRATIRVLESGITAMANDDGRYRLLLPPGDWELSVSHVTHYTQTIEISLSDSSMIQDISLAPSVVVLTGTTVYSRNYNAGQEIILKAIRRKQEILRRLSDYQYGAYSKVSVSDMSKEGVESILLIAESQTTAYWKYPDQYKEIITARRQTANIEAEGNLVTVGEILNFNKNRIDIGKYSIVSPTAEDAFDAYEYYLIDTIMTDGKPVFRLEIEPKSQTTPLFYGHIDIADSTYDVVAVSVGFNDAVRLEFIDSLFYRQQFADFGDNVWMPVEIGLTGQVHFGMKIPGIPKDLSFSHSASLYSFKYDQGIPSGLIDDFVLEVDEKADDIDSAAWNQRQTIPLTNLELAAFDRMDSLENVPPTIGKRALKIGSGLILATMAYSDIYHFNRVEGSYFGLGST
ncbi:MAG: DUF5686 family protein, partial [bacterium]|nr:DUF5686 family protein [bacterium]